MLFPILLCFHFLIVGSSITPSVPTKAPTLSPAPSPIAPTSSPTPAPTGAPTTHSPTSAPTTSSPTTFSPTFSPTTLSPTLSPTVSPTYSPTVSPTTPIPTSSPTTSNPTAQPTSAPTSSPTKAPTTAKPTTAAPTYKSVSGAFKFLGSQSDPNALGVVDASAVTLIGDSAGTVQVAAFFNIALVCEAESRFVCNSDNTIYVNSTDVEELDGTPLTVLGTNATRTLHLKHHVTGQIVIHPPQFISNGGASGGGVPFVLTLIQNPNCPDNFWACNKTIFCCGCPEGGECVRGRFPEPLPGFIKVSNTFFLQCNPEGACDRGECVSPPYTNRERACDTCVEGYYRKNQECIECPNIAKLVLTVGVFFFLFALLVILKVSKTSDSNTFAFTIALAFIQLISIYATLPFPWPSTTTVMFDVLSFTNFNVDLFSPECAVSSTYWSKWVLKLMFPVIACAVFAGLYAIVKKYETPRYIYIYFLLFSPTDWFLKVTRLEAKHKKLIARIATISPTATYTSSLTPGEIRAAAFQWEEENLSCRFVAALTQCAAVLYTFLSKTATDPLNCIQQTDGSLLLRADPSVACYDSTWNSHAVLMVMALILYVVGIPLFLFVVLFRAYKAKQLDSSDIYYRYGFLVLPYRTQFWYWESIQMARKLVTVILINFGAGRFGTASTAQINGMILALLLFLALQEFVKPYQLAWCNRVAFSWTIASVLVLVAALLFQKKVLSPGQENGYAAGLIVACVVAAVVSVVCYYKEKAHARAMKFELQGTHRLDREREERRVLAEMFGPDVGSAVFRKARSLSAKDRSAFMGRIARASSRPDNIELASTRVGSASTSSFDPASKDMHARLVLKFGPRVGTILSNTLDVSTQREILEDTPEVPPPLFPLAAQSPHLSQALVEPES